MTLHRTRFGIIRHAPTEWNEQNRIQGQQDSRLSETGICLAEQWGRELGALKWDRFLCSDLGRARQTMERVNRTLHLPAAYDRRLREQDWGEWTGMTLKEIKAQDKALLRRQVEQGWDFRPPGGESRREVLARSKAALVDAFGAHPDSNILVICHEGVIKCLLYHLLGRQFLPEEPKVVQGYSLHLLRMEEDSGPTLETMNALELTAAGNMLHGK